MEPPKGHASVWRSRLGPAVLLGAVIALVLGLAVSAQAETLPSTTTTSSVSAGSAIVTTGAIGTTGAIRTHSNDGVGSASASFSVACGSCHVAHEAPAANLLASGGAVCAKCHDTNAVHSDPATKQSVAASPASGDCLSCHPHSSGFMPVAPSLLLTKQSPGYDDIDGNGSLSPGDRVHYRVDYANPESYEATGVTLGDTPDVTHVLSVEAVSDGGTFDGTAIKWNIGTLAAGTSGFVTYDLVLGDASFFSGSTTTTTETTTTTDLPTTTTAATATTDSTTTTFTADSPTTTTTTDGTTTTATTDGTTTTTATTSTVEGTVATDTTATTDGSTVTTVTTIPETAGSVDVVNTATLIADNQAPVSASATISVAVAGGSSTTTPTTSATADSTTTTTTDSTTTTSSTTPSTTAPPQIQVVSAATLTADNRDAVSTSAVVWLIPPGSPVAPSANSATGQSATTTEATTATTPPEIEGMMTEAALATTVFDWSAPYLSEWALGYDDLDGDGYLSPGDRVHYRIDYANIAPEDVTGVVLREELDVAHVASVEAIAGDGSVVRGSAAGIATAIQWNIGTLTTGASGFVTYDALLRTDPVMVRPGWVFPVAGPNHYSDSFGAPRYAGGYHTHKGTDIMCARGTALVAVVGGIISRADPTDTGLGGIHIWLHGDDGNYYYYAHLSAIQSGIGPGVRVGAGQVIGFAGNTGDAAGGPVHLHFEIHPHGGPAIDPYLVLKGAATVAQVPIVDPSSTTTTTTTSTTLPTDTTTTTLPTDTTTTVPTDTTTTLPTDSTTTTTLPTDSTTTTTLPTDTTTTLPADSTTTTSLPADTTTTTVSTPST